MERRLSGPPAAVANPLWRLLINENLSNFDDDPRHNLTDRGIAIARGKLEAAGVPVAGRIHVLNQWR